MKEEPSDPSDVNETAVETAADEKFCGEETSISPGRIKAGILFKAAELGWPARPGAFWGRPARPGADQVFFFGKACKICLKLFWH